MAVAISAWGLVSDRTALRNQHRNSIDQRISAPAFNTNNLHIWRLQPQSPKANRTSQPLQHPRIEFH